MFNSSKKNGRTNRPVRVRLQYAPQRQKWAWVRKHLLEFPAHFYPQQAAELVDCCRRSAVLRRVVPHVSLGRIGLELPRSAQGSPLSTNDSPCLFFRQGQYIVSSYDNETQWPFGTAAQAIAFAEKNLTVVPRI